MSLLDKAPNGEQQNAAESLITTVSKLISITTTTTITRRIIKQEVTFIAKFSSEAWRAACAQTVAERAMARVAVDWALAGTVEPVGGVGAAWGADS